MRGPAALLRRRRARPGGPLGGGVPEGPHLVHPPRADRRRRRRSRPWNYPLMMAIWKIAPALAAGNTIVLKPSDTTPASTTLLAELAQEFLPPGVLNVVCGDRDTGRALVEHPTPAAGRDHRARCGPGWRSPAQRPARSSASTSSSAARRRSSSSTTPTSRRRPRRIADRPATSTPARTAPRPPGCWPAPASTTTSSPPSPRRRRGPGPGCRRRGRALRPAQQRRPARPGRRHGRPASPTTPPCRPAVQAGREPWLLLRADRRLRAAPGRRADPGGDLRAGHHRAAVLRRGRGAAVGQRRQVRPRLLGVDQGPRPRDADVEAARLRRACGSTPTSRSSPRCRTAASSTPATARTCRCTGWRTTPASST